MERTSISQGSSVGKKQTGFTIVELLIVIVVIGILASITVVAYNGIQERARRTQVISSANGYLKAMRIYLTQYGQYPITYNACFGDTNPDSNGDGIGDCGTNGNTNESAALIAELEKVISPLPRVDFPPITQGADVITGIRYNWTAGTRVVDGESRPLMLLYYLEGSGQECGLPGVVQDLGSGQWKTGAKYTYTTADKTSCYVSLPSA